MLKIGHIFIIRVLSVEADGTWKYVLELCKKSGNQQRVQVPRNETLDKSWNPD